MQDYRKNIYSFHFVHILLFDVFVNHTVMFWCERNFMKRYYMGFQSILLLI